MTYKKPSVTADLIVTRNNGLLEEILLVKRKHEPYKNYWAMPGGFLDVDKETVEEAGVRELKEETCLVTSINDLELVGISSKLGKDPRGHIVSPFFYVKKYTGKPKGNDDAKELAWFPINQLPKMAFDHEEVIRKYKFWKKDGK
jgi:8-oxo-dGTP diphosphatase